jgi:protein-tyrosine phosphatase
MTADRHLPWEGCYNARDLGGLPLIDGGETRWGTTFRSDNPQRLTAEAWQHAYDLGIRTVIDLRGSYEVRPDGRPADIESLNIVLDDESDTEFWHDWAPELNCTPLYYPAFLDRFPHKVAEVSTAIARAKPGGVLYHCAAGRDRTGLISLVLLHLVGVEPEAIAADHSLSNERLVPAWADLGMADQTAVIEKSITERNTTARKSILSTLATLDSARYLRNSGLTSADIDALRARLR